MINWLPPWKRQGTQTQLRRYWAPAGDCQGIGMMTIDNCSLCSCGWEERVNKDGRWFREQQPPGGSPQREGGATFGLGYQAWPLLGGEVENWSQSKMGARSGGRRKARTKLACLSSIRKFWFTRRYQERVRAEGRVWQVGKNPGTEGPRSQRKDF